MFPRSPRCDELRTSALPAEKDEVGIVERPVVPDRGLSPYHPLKERSDIVEIPESVPFKDWFGRAWRGLHCVVREYSRIGFSLIDSDAQPE